MNDGSMGGIISKTGNMSDFSIIKENQEIKVVQGCVIDLPLCIFFV